MSFLEKELEKQIENNMLHKVNDDLYLSSYQMNVLKEHHIPYETCKDSKELLFLLSDISDEEEFDELEEVANNIAEMSYYKDTRK